MKRQILIIVAVVLCAKLFGSIVVKLASAPTVRISDALRFDDGTNVFDFLRLGENPQNQNQTHRLETPIKQKSLPVVKVQPKPLVPAKPFVAKKITAVDVKKILAANEMKALQDKKDEEDKKEKERRKKRRKALEKLADKPPQIPVIPRFVVQNPTIVPNQDIPTIIGGIQNPKPVATTVVTATTVTKKNVIPVAAARLNLDSIADQLVNHPDASLMKSFIAMFRSNQITAVQFFKVLGQMEKSHIADSRRYAVITATQFQRFESFELLSQESFIEPDAKIQTLVTQGLQAYQNFTQLGALSAALSQGGVESKIRASEVLDHIITGLAGNKNPPTNTETLLNPFVALLEPLTHNSNPVLQASASTALQDIKKVPTILGSL